MPIDWISERQGGERGQCTLLDGWLCCRRILRGTRILAGHWLDHITHEGKLRAILRNL